MKNSQSNSDQNNAVNQTASVGARGVAEAKKKKTHYVASMAILAVALVLVVAIVVVAVIAGIGRASLSAEGLQLHGYTAPEIYSQIKGNVESSGNYTVKMQKVGSAKLNDSTLSVNIVTDIEARVDGENFYYKSTTQTTYIGPKGADQSTTQVVKEIAVVDGVAYVKSGNEKIKQAVVDDSYKKDFDVFKSILWDSSTMFEDARFESIFAGGYKVAANESKALYDVTLAADLKSFFANNLSTWIFPFAPVCSNASYEIIYDNERKPTDITAGYKIADVINSFISGGTDMTVKFTYGNASVSIPDDADSYKYVEAPTE